MVLLEFSITPLGKATSVSPYVARAVQIIAASGLPYELHSMGTIVEGELDAVLGLLQKCVEDLATDCDRVTCTAKLDYRPGHQGRLLSKVESVQQKLGQDTEASL